MTSIYSIQIHAHMNNISTACCCFTQNVKKYCGGLFTQNIFLPKLYIYHGLARLDIIIWIISAIGSLIMLANTPIFIIVTNSDTGIPVSTLVANFMKKAMVKDLVKDLAKKLAKGWALLNWANQKQLIFGFDRRDWICMYVL